jgi:glutamyl/glutaminyl-tRNA synthetase
VLRNEDLDPQRSKPEYAQAFFEDMRWLGMAWQEGPDVGGPFAPYSQSERRSQYLNVWCRLRDIGQIYPCSCSRKDLQMIASAPNEDDEPLYPGKCRACDWDRDIEDPAGYNWRFRVPDGERVTFEDANFGEMSYTVGVDVGDFVVWRRDDVPAYQLAVVADDIAMQITEVVRGADLLKSTARQLLLYRALGATAPAFYHCDLLTDEHGQRLAKRSDALSIRALRDRGLSARDVLTMAGL